jgi:diguanylate cyclase (GGDEF)-like protein
VTLIMGLSGFWLTTNARHRLVEDYRNFAIRTNHVAEAGLENAMISRKPAEITSVLQAIDRREGLDGVMILDMRGTIRYSHDPAEVGRTLRTDDPTCRVCHDRPPTDRPGTVILPSRAGGRILRVARPLLNQPRCQGCHHERVLGMLVTDFSLAEADREIKSLLAGLLLWTLITLAGVVGATVGFVYLEVARPLTAFLKVTQSIGEGDANQRVALLRRDEIGELAASFDRMMERLAERTRALEAVNSVAATVSQSLDLKEVMQTALARVCQVSDSEWGTIFLFDDQTDEFILAASHGLPSRIEEQLAHSKRGDSFSGWVARSGEPIVVDDPASDPRSAVKLGELKSLAVVPLRTRGRVVGTLGTGSLTRHKFTADEVAMLQTIGHYVVAAMENARLFEETLRLSRTDPLTGLLNRRAMEEKLQEELRRARRYRHPLSVIMADIDHFKLFNDTHGHPEGDLVLRKVAEALVAKARNIDFIARYGGDEFLIILPETSKTHALGVAERIRGAVAQTSFTNAETLPGRRLTLSLGVATFPDDLGEGGDLVQRADEALYAAKQTGRDRVCGA